MRSAASLKLPKFARDRRFNVPKPIINIKSTLTNVSQSIGALPHGDKDTKEKLRKLVDDLNGMLGTVPEASGEQAEAVAASAKNLFDIAKQEKPNKTMLQIATEGLKTAANTLKDAAPAAITIVSQISDIVRSITG